MRLLLVLLNHLSRTNLSHVGIQSNFAKGAALTQEIPALIQFHLDLCQSLTIYRSEHPAFTLLKQSMLLFHKLLNMGKNWLVCGG